MKRRTGIILLWLLVCVPMGAQTNPRDSIIGQARYLKSIYLRKAVVDYV